MILNRGKTLDVYVPKRAYPETDATGTLENIEHRHIVAVLEKTGWRVAGQDGAADILGLKRSTLQAKMKKLGIKRSNKEVPK
jgi:transcriptional regulator with GAF, ATPase, and Fis domain